MSAQQIQTHASIDTLELERSIDFYTRLLGSGPTLLRADYARFDLAEPALVLSLNAVPRLAGSARSPLEHLGLRLVDDAGLDEVRQRLASGGFALEEEPETECCYARLTRFWVKDPSGLRWELFVAREAVIDAPSRSGAADSCCAPGCCATIDA